MKTLKHSTTS